MSEFIPRTMESKGKSIDEAIFRGLQEMGVSIDEVDIETVQEGSKGLLGLGSKPFIVRLTTKPLDLSAVEEAKPQKKRERRPRSERPRREEPRRPEPEANEGGAQPAAGLEAAEAAPEEGEGLEEVSRPRERQRTRRKRGRSDRGEPRQERVVPEDDTVYTPYVPGESECEGAEFLAGVLERMGIGCKLGFAETENALKFRIDSDTMGILIGHRGETLDALQYLTGLVVNKRREEYRRVVLDTENYRNKREDTLILLARRLAAQVRATGTPIVLEPMNPYERRVLHAALQNNPYVTTHSEGEDLDRRVVIEPRE